MSNLPNGFEIYNKPEGLPDRPYRYGRYQKPKYPMSILTVWATAWIISAIAILIDNGEDAIEFATACLVFSAVTFVAKHIRDKMPDVGIGVPFVTIVLSVMNIMMLLFVNILYIVD